MPEFDIAQKLLGWDKMTLDEKHVFLSEYFSHEVNLFVYKKDPVYFEKYVAPILKSKMEKSVIDYYLLDNINEIKDLVRDLNKIQLLNSLEKALIIDCLVKHKEIESANIILKNIQNEIDGIKPDVVQQNRIFDTILSLNALNAQKEGIEKIAEIEAKNVRMVKEKAPALMELKRKTSEAYMPEMRGRQLSDAGSESYFFKDSIKNRGMAYSNCASDVKRSESRGSRYSDSEVSDEQPDIVMTKIESKDSGTTKEYVETNYYQHPSTDTQNLITISQFWFDYAENQIKSEGKKPFLSISLVDIYNTFTDIAGAISLLNLPIKSPEHGYKSLESRKVELKASDNLIIFTKEIKECAGEIKPNVLVAQRYMDLQNKFRGEEYYTFEEFLVGRVYCCEVVITNISDKTMNFDVLVQVPKGSLPIGTSAYQKSRSIMLSSYSTTKFEYHFYFPSVGKFEHFPANVAINSIVVAKATSSILTVVKDRTKISKENYKDVLSTGNSELILSFFKGKMFNAIDGFNWEDIYFMLKDLKFYTEFVKILKSYGIYQDTVWSFSLYHKNDENLISEYLNANTYLKKGMGYYFDSKLIKVRPNEVNLKHLDFYPLLNARTHQVETLDANSADVAERPLILNETFYEHYKQFIKYLIEKPTWEVIDKMNIVHYLILQDRTKEAIDYFNSIPVIKDGEPMKIQYDYLCAYLDFYNGYPDFKIAKSVSEKYANCCISPWKDYFGSVKKQLDEIFNKTSIEEYKETSVRKETQLSLELNGQTITIDYKNLKEAIIKFYIIDLEILFSRTPFLANENSDFNSLRPNFVQKVIFDPLKSDLKVLIPEEFKNKDAVIECQAENMVRMLTYFSTTLKVHIFEPYGELKVTDINGEACPKVYVKVFGQKADGNAFYYKDGYTDARGRFDYTSLSTGRLKYSKKFAIFVMSDIYGSLIKECLPPNTKPEPETKKPEVGIKKKKLENPITIYSRKMS